jgi:parallel beta-helix repeat protein
VRQLKYNIRTGAKKIKTKTIMTVSGATIGITGLIMALAMPLGAKATFGGTVCDVPTDYATIQEAVNDTGCTTINVAAGTYAEHVTINRALTLNGANVGKTGNDTARGSESVIIGDATGAVQLTADDITVDGFTISSASNNLGSGIHMSSTNMGYTIQNNVITHNQIGIYANSSGASTISRNLFDANNQPGASGGAGIYSEFTDHLTIDSNEFKNHTVNNPLIFAATAADVHKNLTVSNNLIHDNGCGCSAVYALSLKDAAFTANDITADASDLRLGGGNHTVAITQNTLHSTVGVNVVDDNVANGTAFGLNTGITVNRNSLTGHSVFGVDNSTGGQTLPVDATCNWWGAANGPGPVGPGSGDKVSTGVTFAPWLTSSSNLNGPCNGGVVATNKDQCKNGGWQTLSDNSFRAFKNQGDCVSFIATKGKNKANG